MISTSESRPKISDSNCECIRELSATSTRLFDDIDNWPSTPICGTAQRTGGKRSLCIWACVSRADVSLRQPSCGANPALGSLQQSCKHLHALQLWFAGCCIFRRYCEFFRRFVLRIMYQGRPAA